MCRRDGKFAERRAAGVYVSQLPADIVEAYTRPHLFHDLDRDMTEQIVESLTEKLKELLRERYPKTLCPSEVPRAIEADELNGMGALTWRDLMPYMRDIVWDLREKREVDVLQGGKVIEGYVQLRDVKGPIRVKNRRPI